jgi:hypothetical protein
MKKIKLLFAAHPSEVNETYVQHLLATLAISSRLFTGAFAQLLHGVFPFVRPPCDRDVCSMINYLKKKTPEYRKCRDVKNSNY